jgi:hypothetical protein
MMTYTSSPRSYLQSTGSPSLTQLIKSSTTCIALYKTFHCGNDKLTPTLVGIVSVFQNLRSTLLLPFHSVSSPYLPPPRGTLTGMFNAWVWSFANVTAKASCIRSPSLWCGLLILIYVTCRMKCETLQSIGCFFLYPAF